MRIDLIKDFYVLNKLKDEDYEYAEALLLDLEKRHQFDAINVAFDDINEARLDALIDTLVEKKANTVNAFIVLLRYFHVISRKDLYIHLTKYIGGLDVIENIIDRLEKLVGKEKKDQMLADLSFPELGTHPRSMPIFTAKFMGRLEKQLSEAEIKQVLTGNNHGVSEKAILPDKLEYEKAESLESFLKDLHKKKISVLQDYADKNRVWFEQNITKEVIDYVKSNQEILSATLIDGKLYMTKIPYDTEKYVQETDARMKRYYACHCPFAREAILDDKVQISPLWCHCSAGFEKFPFEVIFGEKLKIKILESALQGDSKCRFEVSLANVEYK